MINDISTDTTNPPAFVALLPVQSKGRTIAGDGEGSNKRGKDSGKDRGRDSGKENDKESGKDNERAGDRDRGAEKAAADQKTLYPEIKTLIFRKPYYNVVNAACTLVIINGWRWVEAHPMEGRIEATAVSRWLRRKDDIVMRVRPGTSPGTTIFDIRSKSRHNRMDFGANAERVRNFLTAMKDRLR